VDDIARFDPCDAQELVLASFCCPCCLARADRAELTGDAELAAVRCRCVPCDTRWEVAVTGDQRLRLELAPPPRLALVR
jgi:hypothetical protein